MFMKKERQNPRKADPPAQVLPIPVPKKWGARSGKNTKTGDIPRC